jgi:SAM-dependent methyltransferase
MDLDTRFVDALTEPNLTVRQHDIVAEDLPVGEFDLVHARALLAHLPARDAVLHKMVAALRPGGWLLCEELDAITITLLAPDDPTARRIYTKVESAVAAAMARRGHDYEYARRQPARLVAEGLVDVNGEGRSFLRRRGEDAETARLTVEQLTDQMLEAGDVVEADVRSYLELLKARDFLGQTALMVAAWGRRPPFRS